MTPGLHEPHVESSHGPQSGDVHVLPGPLDGAARGGPVSSLHSQQDRYFLCLDLNVVRNKKLTIYIQHIICFKKYIFA